jgi:hypothetical protein
LPPAGSSISVSNNNNIYQTLLLFTKRRQPDTGKTLSVSLFIYFVPCRGQIIPKDLIPTYIRDFLNRFDKKTAGRSLRRYIKNFTSETRAFAFSHKKLTYSLCQPLG